MHVYIVIVTRRNKNGGADLVGSAPFYTEGCARAYARGYPAPYNTHITQAVIVP